MIPMEDFDPEINQLIQRFFEHVNGEGRQYFDVDDLVTIFEYFVDNDLLEHARTALKVAKELYPDDMLTIAKEAELNLIDGRVKKAYELLVRIEPSGEPMVISMIGECMLRMHKIKEAREYFDRYLTVCPAEDLQQSLVDIANLFNHYKQYKLSLEYSDQGVTMFPDNTEILYERVYSLVSLRRYEEAIPVYDDILDRNSYDTETWLALAALHEDLGHYADAIRCYDYVSALKPDDVETERRMASCYLRMEETEAAIDILEGLHGRYPKNYDVTLSLSKAYNYDGKPELALPLLLDVIEHYPIYPEAFVEYANCVFVYNQDYAQALRVMQRAHRLFPDNTEVLFTLGKFEVNIKCNGNDEELYLTGMQHLLDCIEAEPKHPVFNNAIGIGYLYSSDFLPALHHFTVALNSDANINNIYINLAVAAWGLQDMTLFDQYFVEARRRYSNADAIIIKLFPETEEYIKNHF